MKPWLAVVGGGALLGAGIAAVVGRRRPELGRASPEAWWTRKRPRERAVCYTTKADALNVMRDTNHRLIEEWGGLDIESSAAEFDAINHRYGLRGDKHTVKSIADALWVAMPTGRPFCLDRIDLDTLNETSPGQLGVGFQLPSWVVDAEIAREEARYYREKDEAATATY